MKTAILLSAASLFVSTFSMAQTGKGNIQLGGSLGIAHQNTDEIPGGVPTQRYTTVSVSPSVGKFYKDNKLAGLFLNFNYYESLYSNRSINRTFGGGAFLRQYQPIIKSLYLLFDERLGGNYYSGTNIYYTQTGEAVSNKFQGFGTSLFAQAGLAYNLNKRVQLEMLLNNLLYAGFAHSNTGTNYYISSSLDGNAFSNILFGFRYSIQ